MVRQYCDFTKRRECFSGDRADIDEINHGLRRAGVPCAFSLDESTTTRSALRLRVGSAEVELQAEECLDLQNALFEARSLLADRNRNEQ